jgi:indolepyruvate ferredoxin oxidoreductase beta subunit
VKGYGETHERGWRNFSALLGQVDALAARSDGGAVLARLIDAALADEEGNTLRREIAALGAPASPQPAAVATAGTGRAA